jgi:intracellular multiplication protein IcmE
VSKPLSKVGLIMRRLGGGGPGRLVMIAGIGALMIAMVIGVSMRTEDAPPESKVAKMPPINPLPGGTHSNPAQDALLLRSSQDKAREAEGKGKSYTPPMPASVPLRPRPAVEEPEPVVQVAEKDMPRPIQAVVVKPVPAPVFVRPERPLPEDDVPESLPEARIEKIASTGSVEMSPEFKLAVDNLFKNWQGQAPHTNIVLVPADGGIGSDRGASPSAPVRHEPVDRSATVGGALPPEKGPVPSVKEKVLVPAGRGIFAHTVVGVNSDAGGPIVLEADSGPLAGDRMIGNFAKSTKDRLVVRVTSIEHRGQTLDVSGLVVAPDSMETSVASSVDNHYVERFALPAAAAFIEGIGDAIIASKSTTVVSPFGGATSYLNGGLNLQQQAAVAGAAAASEVGSILKKETPKVPTIYLAANVTVGVMFLSNVTLPVTASK